MKRWMTLLFLGSSLFSESIPTPFSLNATYVNVGLASFKNLENESLHFSQANVSFSYLHPLECERGLVFGAGYVDSHLKWKENPDFSKTRFSYINFTLTGFTRFDAFEKCLWNFTASGAFDMNKFDFKDYALYQFALDGKYEISPSLLFDLGFFLETGLSDWQIWPIVGFSYFPCDHWTFSAVYPVNISFEYFLSSHFSLGGSIRFLRDHHRVDETEPLPKAIFEYENTGIEIDFSFFPVYTLIFQGFVGYTLGDVLKISDENNANAHYYSFKGALYGGGSITFSY